MWACIYRSQQLLCQPLQQHALPPRRSVARGIAVQACNTAVNDGMPGRRMEGDAGGEAPMPAAALTSVIKRAADWHRLRTLQRRHSGQLNHIHIAAMLTHAAQLAGTAAAGAQGDGGAGEQQPRQHQHYATASSEDAQRRDWALQLLQLAEERAGTFSTRQLSNMLWAAARLRVQLPSSCLAALLAALSAQMSAAGGQDLANALWALASMQRPPPGDWLASYWQRSGQLLRAGALPPAELASTAHAVAALQLQPPAPWLEALLAAAAARPGSMQPQAWASLAWALAVMGHCPDPDWLLGSVLPSLPACNGQQLAGLLWALMRLQCRPSPAWQAAFVGAATRQLPTMDAHSLALMAAQLHSLLQLSADGSASSSSAAASSAATSDPGDGAQHAGNACRDLLWQLQLAAGRLGGQRLSERDASGLAWAAGSLRPSGGQQPGAHTLPWAAAYLQAHQGSLAHAGPSTLVHLLWVAARAGAPPTPAWLLGFAAAAGGQLPASFTPSQLGQLLWAAAELEAVVGSRPQGPGAFRLGPRTPQPALPAPLVASLLQAAGPRLQQLAPGDVAAASASAARLAGAGHQLPPSFLRALAAAVADAASGMSPAQHVCVLRDAHRLAGGPQLRAGRQHRQPGAEAVAAADVAAPTAAAAAAASIEQQAPLDAASPPAAPAAGDATTSEEQQALHQVAGAVLDAALRLLASPAAGAAGTPNTGASASRACQVAAALAAAGIHPPSAAQQALLAAALQQPEALSHADACAALRAAGCWRCSVRGGGMQRLAGALAQRAPAWEAGRICRLLAVAAPLEALPPMRQLSSQLWAALQGRVRGEGVAGGMDVLWQLAWTRTQVPSDWLQEVLYELQPLLPGCSLLELLQACRALVLLQAPPSGARDLFLSQLLASSLQLLGSGDPARPATEQAGDAASQQQDEGPGADAGSSLQAAQEQAEDAAPQQAAPGASAGSDMPRLLTALLASLARLQAAPPVQWMHACCQAFVDAQASCSADDMHRLLLALAALQYRPCEAHVQALLGRCGQLLPSFSLPQLCSVLHLLAKLRCAPSEPWMDAYYACFDALAGGGGLRVQGFVAVVWALAKMDARPDPEWLQQALGTCSAPGLGDWAPQHLANTICAFTRLRFNPGRAWLGQFSEAVGAAQAGAGGLQAMDAFHIEWAWRELNDGFAPPAAGQGEGGAGGFLGPAASPSS